MGCDIHGTIEKRVGDKWVMVSRIYGMERIMQRNYAFFALLASVRGKSERKPLGLPDNVSDSTKLYSDEWGIDVHSHSYLSLREVIKIYEEVDGYVEKFLIAYCLFGLDIDECDYDSYRFVFWFDN